MSGHQNHFGKMLAADDAITNVKTLYKAKLMYREWDDKASRHEWASQKEAQNAENYRKRMQMLKERWGDEVDEYLNAQKAAKNVDERDPEPAQ